jgi:hypothetical protein
MPDGTSVGGVASTLFQTMNTAAATATWQQQFLKAAAVWEAVAHLNLVQVPDNGAVVGGAGDQQGDPQFGDIRIGAVPERNGTLAMAFLPPPKNGGSLAGDILFNSSVNWQISTGYDIESVAIHEIGHALGMDHSQVQQAVMYASYNGVKQSLTTDDVAGIQSVYSAPPVNSANASASSAIDLTPMINGSGQVTLGGQYDGSAAQQTWYKVTVPGATTGTMTVSMQSTNLSELSPKVTIYNSSVQGIAQVANANTYGSTATVTLNGVTAGQVYYIRAMAANTGATGVGAYGLLVNFGSQAQAPVAPPNTVMASQASQGDGSSAETSGGGGGLLGGLLGGLASDVGSLLGYVLNGVIHIGTLTGAGDALTAAEHHHRSGHSANHPHGAVHNARRPSGHLTTHAAGGDAGAALHVHDLALAHLGGHG